LNRGFAPVASFAYPYAEYNATVQSIVRECGYTSARGVGGIRSGSQCGGCPYAETIPPGDAYATLTPEDISSQTSLATMQSYVTQAEQGGGGWVQFVIHGIGDRGGVPLSQFTAFLDWLQPRAANGTVVRTVYEVISGAPPPPPGVDTFPPVTTIVCNGAPCSGWYAPPVTITLTATDSGGVAATRYTTDGSEPTDSSLAYADPFGVSTTTTLRYRSWDTAGNVEATKTQHYPTSRRIDKHRAPYDDRGERFGSAIRNSSGRVPRRRSLDRFGELGALPNYVANFEKGRRPASAHGDRYQRGRHVDDVESGHHDYRLGRVGQA